MARRLVVQPQSDLDIQAATLWYEDQQDGRGRLFYEAVSTTLDSVADMPLAFPRVHGDTRRARVRGYPYAVYFKVHDEASHVVAIVHNSRHPDRWRSRI